jgi:diguanylate cyclase (GGDEF)-like protein
MYSSIEVVPSKAQRWVAGLSCAVLAGFAIGTLPFANRPLPVEAAFLPIHLTLAVTCDLFTALLLIIQFRASGYTPLALLAIAYTATGTIAVAQMCAFPGVLAPLGLFGARPQTSIWLWTAWHGGFPALVILYAWGRRAASSRIEPQRTHVGGTLVAGVALGVVAALVAYLAPLPTLVAGVDYGAGFHGTWQTVIALSLLSIIATVVFTRLVSVLDLWLTVALVGFLCDVMMTIFGGARYSTGWYLARVFAVFTSLTVATMFIVELAGLYMRFARLASTDPLTGLGNRRTFDDRLDEALRAGVRDGTQLALLMLDVDDFKRYNDTYGHMAGDDALRQVAAVARGAANRPRDTVARFGGEEFAIVLPCTGLPGATSVAEKVRVELGRRKIPHSANRAGPTLTVSIGVTVTQAAESGAYTLIQRADMALYRAKASGRDCVVTDTMFPIGVDSIVSPAAI